MARATSSSLRTPGARIVPPGGSTSTGAAARNGSAVLAVAGPITRPLRATT